MYTTKYRSRSDIRRRRVHTIISLGRDYLQLFHIQIVCNILRDPLVARMPNCLFQGAKKETSKPGVHIHIYTLSSWHSWDAYGRPGDLRCHNDLSEYRTLHTASICLPTTAEISYSGLKMLTSHFYLFTYS